MIALTPTKNLSVKLRRKLKNPLGSLRAEVGAFAIAKSGPERQQLFSVIDHDVLRIDRLVSDISIASKLDSDLLKDQESELELVPMILRLLQYFEQKAAVTGIALVADMPENPSKWLAWNSGWRRSWSI